MLQYENYKRSYFIVECVTSMNMVSKLFVVIELSLAKSRGKCRQNKQFNIQLCFLCTETLCELITESQ